MTAGTGPGPGKDADVEPGRPTGSLPGSFALAVGDGGGEGQPAEGEKLSVSCAVRSATSLCKPSGCNRQVPLSMGSVHGIRQEYWSGVPFPPPD